MKEEITPISSTWECPDAKLYLGDCLEILPMFADKSVDCVVTDPPYGIGKVWKGGTWGATSKHIEHNNWDMTSPPKEAFEQILRIGNNSIIWGGNYFDLPISRCWLVWTKPQRNFTLADTELAWTSFDKPIRVFDGLRAEGESEHPTPKPISLMKWCVEKYTKPNDLILDPFMGSGTTGVAARELGRKFIGIELNPQYFEIAKKRIDGAREQESLFNPPPLG